MLRPASRITRSAVRLLADPKFFQNLTLPHVRSLHQHPPTHLPLFSRNPTSAASFFASASRCPTQGGIEEPQTRSLTSTSRSSTRHLRSDVRYRNVPINQPPVGSRTDGDLPRKDRKANPFLPFQATSFLDAFVTTIVGVGISESCWLQVGRVGMKLKECSYSFYCRYCIPRVVQMEGSKQGIDHTRPSASTHPKMMLSNLDAGCLQRWI